MHNYCFYLDGECSLDHGIFLQRPLNFPKPSKKYRTVTIPGRNGELHYFENAYEPVESTAQCFILGENAETKLGESTNWLFQGGQRLLETPEDPDYYRLCYILSGYDMDVRINTLSVFEPVFSCGPERWRKDGRFPIEISSGEILYNYYMDSMPLIEILGNGKGSLTIGGCSVNVLSLSNSVTLDSQTQNAFSGLENKNNTIKTPNGFPVLLHGKNKVSYTGGITGIKITPRWWSL